MLKGFQYEYRSVSLIGDRGTQTPEFQKINPYKQIPSLVIEDSGKQVVLSQSLAIIQYLDEAYPDTTPLLPADPLARAQVRTISDCIAAGIQPLQNVTVIDYLNSNGLSGSEFAGETISTRFSDLEVILKDCSGKYCVGDEVTMADLCLAPQVYNAGRFGVDMSKFPVISRINENLMKIPAFEKGHPAKQPDTPAQ